MAFTITNEQIAVLIRAAPDVDNVPTQTALVLQFMVPAAKKMIEEYAPGAPDDVANSALVRLSGFLFDQDPAESIQVNPLRISGASSMLSQWRFHDVGAIDPDDESAIIPRPVPQGTIPAPPQSGFFTLASDNGTFEWLPFPKPS